MGFGWGSTPQALAALPSLRGTLDCSRKLVSRWAKLDHCRVNPKLVSEWSKERVVLKFETGSFLQALLDERHFGKRGGFAIHHSLKGAFFQRCFLDNLFWSWTEVLWKTTDEFHHLAQAARCFISFVTIYLGWSTSNHPFFLGQSFWMAKSQFGSFPHFRKKHAFESDFSHTTCHTAASRDKLREQVSWVGVVMVKKICQVFPCPMGPIGPFSKWGGVISIFWIIVRLR